MPAPRRPPRTRHRAGNDMATDREPESRPVAAWTGSVRPAVSELTVAVRAPRRRLPVAHHGEAVALARRQRHHRPRCVLPELALAVAAPGRPPSDAGEGEGVEAARGDVRRRSARSTEREVSPRAVEVAVADLSEPVVPPAPYVAIGRHDQRVQAPRGHGGHRVQPGTGSGVGLQGRSYVPLRSPWCTARARCRFPLRAVHICCCPTRGRSRSRGARG